MGRATPPSPPKKTDQRQRDTDAHYAHNSTRLGFYFAGWPFFFAHYSLFELRRQVLHDLSTTHTKIAHRRLFSLVNFSSIGTDSFTFRTGLELGIVKNQGNEVIKMEEIMRVNDATLQAGAIRHLRSNSERLTFLHNVI